MNPWIKEARSLHAAGDGKNARLALEAAQTTSAKTFDWMLTDALLELQFGDLALATKRLHRIDKRFPRTYEILFNLGVSYRFANNETDALLYFERAEKAKPGTPAVAKHRAELLSILGRFEEAIAIDREQLSRRPDRLSSLLHIASIKVDELTDGEISQLVKAVSGLGNENGLAVALNFALGDIFWKNDRARALDYYHAANAGKRANLNQTQKSGSAIAPKRMQPVRRALDKAETREIELSEFVRSRFDAAFLAQYLDQGFSNASPIFVMGMPRSGSTLVEQIISAHPSVSARGETGLVSKSMVAQNWPYLGRALGHAPPTRSMEVDPKDHYERTGRNYVSELRNGDTRHIRWTDKSLDNFNHIGTIHLALPRAPIVVVMRNPVDNGLACYRKNFRTGLEWTYDLASIGRRYCRFRDMIDHWQQVLPGRLSFISYDELITDPETVSRRLIEDVGLDWHQNCLEFHSSKNPVRTASIAQVRQPIYKTSVGTWKDVSHKIWPLLDALGPYANDIESR